MSDELFTEQDLIQWKNNPVTKALLKSIEHAISATEEIIIHRQHDNIYYVGEMQGLREGFAEAKRFIEESNLEELLYEIKEETDE